MADPTMLTAEERQIALTATSGRQFHDYVEIVCVALKRAYEHADHQEYIRLCRLLAQAASETAQKIEQHEAEKQAAAEREQQIAQLGERIRTRLASVSTVKYRLPNDPIREDMLREIYDEGRALGLPWGRYVSEKLDA